MEKELLNLENLTEEERSVILNVIKRDERLRKTEDNKISQLKQEIQFIRMKSVLRNGDDLSKICARCHAELGRLFNRGDICPKCRFRVCNLCQENLLNGKWLCALCYRQRQLQYFQGNLDKGSKGMKRWPSGADLVKASIKKTLVVHIHDGAESDPGTESTKQNGGFVTNGNAHRDINSGNTSERVEYPRESDKRKLTQLFDSFKGPKQQTPERTLVRRATSRKYSDTESSSSSDEDVTSSVPPSVLDTSVCSSNSPSLDRGAVPTERGHGSDFDDLSASDLVNSKTSSNSASSSPRKSIQRMHSYDSDQTIHSDDPPFSKSSTETQIRVEVHSDSSSTKSADICRPKTSPTKPKGSKPKHSLVEHSRKDSSSSQRSISPDRVGGNNYHYMRQSATPQGRSSSPYSFDSIPSSHANSPLPKKRLIDLAAEYGGSSLYSSDTDSHSRCSATEYSGTESQARASEGLNSENDEFVVEELSKIKFKRTSTKSDTRKSTLGGQQGETQAKLSPRASSEGSASLEDSGHVSGSSTQDNTPEHRRTESLQSQISVPSSLSTVTDKEDESEGDIDELVAYHKATSSSYGSSFGNLLSTISDSKESIASFYSNAGDVDYGKIPVTGEIQFGIDYNYRTSTLEISIRQCRELAPADTKHNRSDPYVKTYLLPDKTRGGKRKTKVKKNALNPVFDESLRYFISKSELENRTLWVTVWHNDRFGRNDFLGEVSINFDYFRFGDSAFKWYKLQERVETPSASLLTYRGDLVLSMKYVSEDKVKDMVMSPARKKGRRKGMGRGGQLQVLIKEARNLTAVRSNGYSDPFCKGYLLPDKHRSGKQKTPVIRRECNPQWNHTFIFDDVTREELRERALELSIWDHDKLSSNEFLGGVRINLGTGRSSGRVVDWMDAKGEEISLWQAMLDRPNSLIDGALNLRPNMDKRKY